MWYQECYIRMLIDNHIMDIHPSFMAKFDPEKYVSMVKKAGVDSTVISACCHNGNCYYPTKIGRMHENLNGRDIFGETVKLLRQAGIVPIAYYTTIFNNHAAKTHPQWRFLNPRCEEHLGRYWLLCANSREYLEYCRKQITEITQYDIGGFFLDMTFWQGICVCHRCRERYLRESGREIPTVIDWNSPEWVGFQRCREQWIAEYARELTDAVKSINPNLTVAHQFAPVLKSWYYAQTPHIAQASDYASGDFYGGRDQQRFGTKVMGAFSKDMPYEWMTSQSVNLQDHTSTKSKDEVLSAAATTLANAGAHLFVDAINPDGTLCESIYETLRDVTNRLAPFKAKLGETRPVVFADTGLYYSMASQVHERFNGRSAAELPDNINFTDSRSINEILGTSIILSNAKMPYRIITTPSDVEGLHSLIINNAMFLADEEVRRIRHFVKEGGTLLATGMTSFYDLEGNTSGDFALSDVFGVSYTGAMSKQINYLAVENKSEFICAYEESPLVKSTSAEVLGKVAEPLYDLEDTEHYASIHSDPPGPAGEYAGLTINKYGKGKCIYLYSSLLALQNDAQQSFGKTLLKSFLTPSLTVDTNAPECVEITLLKGTKKDSILFCLVNYQKELPNLPIYDIEVTLQLPNQRKPKCCKTVSDNREIEYKAGGSKITFTIPRLETIEMIEIQ